MSMVSDLYIQSRFIIVQASIKKLNLVAEEIAAMRHSRMLQVLCGNVSIVLIWSMCGDFG